MGASDDQSLYLYAPKMPSIIPIELLYDPDKDPTTDGKIIGTIDSLVPTKIDDTKYLIQVIDKVDPVTKKSTLVDVGWIVTDETADEAIRILSYGNNRWCVFFDDRTEITNLTITKTLVLFGIENVDYRLVRVHPDGEEEIVSVYLRNDGAILGDRIPMSVDDPTRPGIKTCTNCHTFSPLTEGETLLLQVFNTKGTQTVELRLFVRRSVLLNDLASIANPIVHFGMEASQEVGDNFYLIEKQDPAHLAVQTYIIYADGTKEYIPIDGRQCFLYGLDDLQPSYIGQKKRIMAKYYLTNRQNATGAETDLLTKYLVCYKDVVIQSNNTSFGIKLSFMPYWDIVTNAYQAKIFAYFERRDQAMDVTDLVSVTGFDGTKFYDEQKVTLDLDLADIFSSVLASTYRQHVWVKLFPSDEYMKYTLRDSDTTDVLYGMESTHWKRPIIHYDEDLEIYFIPTTKFLDKDHFLTEFYYRASPPTPADDSLVPTVPTHFTVRDPTTGSVLISAPIPVEQYGQAWSAILASPSLLVGRLVITEFLVRINDAYAIIYGAAQEVVVSATGYQG